jgi:hypothetical protein
MQVTVKLFASFRVGRFTEAERDVAPGIRIAEVAESLGILPEDIGIIMVNGRHAALENELQPGARLSLFPLLGGG